MTSKQETICAPATSGGGAISIIRISGSQSFSICDKLFIPADESLILKEQKGFQIFHGIIREEEGIIDEVLLSTFKGPHSYTGEDSIEISCHGSSYIVTRILELLIKGGARIAKPGEFTQRAFLNGKMDLSQAEAVADLVASSSRASHRIAISQMKGVFSDEISKLRSDLLNFVSLIELELDFGEEDVEFADRKDLLKIVYRIKDISDRLASSFILGNAIRNGIPVVIAGKPNTGKSTLLNALLMEDKAIVSEIPGTTRDVIEDTIVIDGIEFRFIDTAGLHETSDIIENLGIQKTHEKISQAAVILLVDEISDDSELINQRAENIRKMISGSEKRLMIVVNKMDLCTQSRLDTLKKEIILKSNDNLLFISAKEKYGLDELRKKLGEAVETGKLKSGDIIITNVRHYEALLHVSDSLERVVRGLNESLPEDLIALDIRQAIHYLGEITGLITTDEILGTIFSKFCIGK